MLAMLLAVQYRIMNSRGGLSANASNISSMTGLLQYENTSPCLYGQTNLLGFAILAIVMMVAFGIGAMRFDVVAAGAVAVWIGTGVALFLIQLSLVSANIMGVLLGLALIMTFISLVKGGLNPY